MEASSSADLANVISTVLATTSSSYENLILTFQTFIMIVGAVFGANFIWNHYISNKVVKNKVDKLFDKAEKSFEKEIADKIEKAKESVKEEVLNATNEKLKRLECEQARNFAILTDTTKLYDVSLDWWFNSLELAIEVDLKESVGRTTGAIVNLLENEAKTATFNLEEISFDEYEAITRNIPEYLFSQKKSILKKLSNLKTKRSKQSEK